MSLQALAGSAIRLALKLGCEYCDVRTEETEKRKVSVDNGEVTYHALSDSGMGVRVLKNGAWAFAALSHPASRERVRRSLAGAVKNAEHASGHRKTKVKLRQSPGTVKTVAYPASTPPELDAAVEIGLQCDSVIREVSNVRKSLTSITWGTTKKIFCSSEGSRIEQDYTDTVGETTATAHDGGITQSVNTTEGGRGGLEQIVGRNDLVARSRDSALKASELVCARPAGEEKTTVVLNPDFVGLLAHEILGHPSEADRVMGREMAWAGGSWWAGKSGERVGSEHLTVFDDPTIRGSLGWYEFDDEGVKSSRTDLVKDGILKNHLQSRETAECFDVRPTANMRAASYCHMPLIRMACTCIDGGDFDPDEMIRDVRSGYLISGMRVPSIDMYRYSWSISCQYANKIENGEVRDLARDVIVMGTAPEFLRSVDACGRDFTVRPITNCGKGDPMQPMMMGNGGPSVRGTATVKSVE